MSLAVSTSEHPNDSPARLTLPSDHCLRALPALAVAIWMAQLRGHRAAAAATYAATRRKAAQLRRAIAHPEIGRIDKRGHPPSARRLLRAEMRQGKRDPSFLDPAASMLQIGATASNVWKLGVS